MAARYNMRSYVVGATSARLGDDMSGPALLLLALAVAGSSTGASLVFGGLTIAAGVGGPLFGIALDRAAKPGRLLAASLVGYAVGLAAVAVLLGRVPLIVTVVAAAVTGLVAPALAGGWTSQLTHVVSTTQLRRGNAVDAATYNLASLGGPGLAAAATAVWGPTWAVAGAVGVLLVAAPFAWRLPSRPEVPPNSSRAITQGVVHELREGFTALMRSNGLRSATAASCTAYLGTGLFVVACPILGAQQLNGAGSGAVLLSLVAAGALCSSTAMAKWSPAWCPETVFSAATALATVALAVIALATSPAGLLIGAVLLGVAEGPQLASVIGIRQRDAPAHLRAQVFTTSASLKLTAGAVGSVVGGVLLERSLTMALLVAAASQLAALALIARPGRTPSSAMATSTDPRN